MSSTASAVADRRSLFTPRRPGAWQAARAVPPPIRLLAFAVLALYGALRWGTLMTGPPTGRLLALVAVAVALAAVGPLLMTRSQILAVVVAVATALAMLALAGLPVSWIRHVRIAVSARHIGYGLSALPRLLVPYRGVNEWVRTVMLLGAAVLLFDGAVMMAFALRAPGPQPAGERGRAGAHDRGGEPGRSGDLRRAVAALPLIALAAVPLTLVPAQFQYFQGAILFGLLAALIWGERLPRHGSGTAAVVCGVAAALAMVLAPAIDAHKPWIQYQTLSGGIAVGFGEAFDWSQGYGPLNWPRTGRQVLWVQAKHGEYWKAVNLNDVDASGWSAGPGDTAGNPLPDVSPSTVAHFSQTITVTVQELRTSDLIGPGELGPPTHFTQAVNPGASPGRWVSVQPMGYGDSYSVRAYSPHPTVAQLQAAGTHYPTSVVPDFLDLSVPAAGQPQPVTAFVDAFGQPLPILVHSTLATQTPPGLLSGSPAFGRAYRLAQRLRARARTPYDYVQSVLAYLRQPGFRYDESPPASRYPLDSFLFVTHRGYCQQFAGAMALLLRLGGVPARVAAGFTAGIFDKTLQRWVVTDYDAHAWVEAYFPGYGWVSFEPTPPGADPAQQHIAPTLGSASALNSVGAAAPKGKAAHGLGTRENRAAATGAHHGAPLGLLVPGGLAAVVVLVMLGSLVRHMLLAGDADTLVAELERAFTRTGRPLVPQATLAQLEHRMDGTPGAQAYVRALAQARYAGDRGLPTPGQRRALRGYLRAGLGITGAVRAWWALPPLLSQRKRPIKGVTGQ